VLSYSPIRLGGIRKANPTPAVSYHIGITKRNVMHEMNWINHLEFIVLLVTLIGGFYLLDAKIERQSDRTDKLYEMFIDLLKEGKK
jgi:hypothetical protein